MASLLRKKYLTTISTIIWIALLSRVDRVCSQDNDYDYGDLSIKYNELDFSDIVTPLASTTRVDKMRLPLCCREGQIYDGSDCKVPDSSSYHWKPFLDGKAHPLFEYSGFPSCEIDTSYIETHQNEVHFEEKEGKVFLPYYIQLSAVPKSQYCITKIEEIECEKFQTKIFSCLVKETDPLVLMWTSVTLAHIMVFLTLLTYILMSDLRCLQGQYMICFLISLFIYNLCLLPGSKITFDISDMACIALGAVKYFFFCGIFLWFNAICFDIWRTLSNRQDISGRRRFLLYSTYSWVVGAILTTIVLVLPYTRDGSSTGSRVDPLRDQAYSVCKLKLEIDMILQIAQLLSLLFDLVFLSMATCAVCSYSKFGNGLPRFDASLSLKQGWKLFAIMVAHLISCIGTDLIQFPIPLWLFVLFESAAVFGVFAYRRTVIKRLMKVVCRSHCVPSNEAGSLNEKNQLTMT